MSKLIVEMEMPKCCWECACCDGEYGYCASRKKPLDDPNERPSWCPIKGVLPDEHGDLIDKQKLLEKGITMSWSVQKWVSEVDIVTARNVVSAERKDDE